MRCDQASAVFDAHLDGDLAPALEMELAAHRVSCADCRRALALLEVAGHVIETDQAPPAPLDDAFTDRLLACVVEQRSQSAHRAVRWMYLGIPLAAAAVIGFAFLGAFDRNDVMIAGKSVVNQDARPAGPVAGGEPVLLGAGDDSQERESAERALEAYLTGIQSHVSDKRDQVKSLQDSLDLTIRQWLDILNSRKDATGDETRFPASRKLSEPAVDPAKADPHEPIEDL